MKKLVSIVLSSVLVLSFAFAMTACSEDAAPIIVTSETNSYADLKAKVDVFDNVYAYYCYEKPEELVISNGEGFSPFGSPCSYTYITNIDGVNKADTVKSCTLEITHDDGSMNIDEYFAVDASTLFIARTTIPADGSLGTVTKYIISDNTCYIIHEAESTIEVVEKPDTLDLYLSFSEIVELYGQSN